MKDYEKAENEHQSRCKKYPSMVLQHEEAKYRFLLNKAEDDLDEIKISTFNSELAMSELEKVIKDCKEKLSKITNDKQDTFE
jgi:hypothetical protein